MERASLGDRWAFGQRHPHWIQRRRGSLIAGAVSLLMFIGITASFADNFQNDVTAGGTDTITAGGSTTITYRLIANNAPSGDVSGCNVDATHPATVTISASAAVTKSVSSFTFTICGNPGAQTVTYGSSTAGSYPINVTISGGVVGATYNDQADFTLTVNAATPTDTTPPVLTLPDDITTEATGPSGATVIYSASATDTVDGSVVVFCSPASGSVFALGTTTVSCFATDDAGNTANGLFTVTVVDTTPPTLTLPANITAEATGSSGAVVTYSASATDVVDGSVPVSCSPASGSTFAIGTTTVNCSATDDAGNTANGSFTVTVQDTTPPTLTLPANITGVVATGQNGAVVTYSASASDLVDGSVPVSCSPASGSTFAIGTTTVNCSATDDAGNTATGSFTVSVIYGQDGQGIRQPINIDNTSLFSRGRAVPVKFGLLNDAPNGFNTGGWSVQAGSVACSVFDTEDAVLEAVAAVQPGGSIRYDSTADQYIYNADFRNKAVGTCWRVFVLFDDGTRLGSATFKLTK
jgi:hypothetical protein